MPEVSPILIQRLEQASAFTRILIWAHTFGTGTSCRLRLHIQIYACRLCLCVFYVYICIDLHVLIYTCVYICTHVMIYVHTHTHTHTHITRYTQAHIYMYACMCVCTHMYIYRTLSAASLDITVDRVLVSRGTTFLAVRNNTWTSFLTKAHTSSVSTVFELSLSWRVRGIYVYTHINRHVGLGTNKLGLGFRA